MKPFAFLSGFLLVLATVHNVNGEEHARVLRRIKDCDTDAPVASDAIDADVLEYNTVLDVKLNGGLGFGAQPGVRSAAAAKAHAPAIHAAPVAAQSTKHKGTAVAQHKSNSAGHVSPVNHHHKHNNNSGTGHEYTPEFLVHSFSSQQLVALLGFAIGACVLAAYVLARPSSRAFSAIMHRSPLINRKGALGAMLRGPSRDALPSWQRPTRAQTWHPSGSETLGVIYEKV